MATATKKKRSLDELKKLIGDTKKKIEAEVPASALSGTAETVVKKLAKIATDSEIVGAWTIKHHAGVNSYYSYQRKAPRTTISGFRPYTDAEIEVLGEKILADKAKAEAAAAKVRAAAVKKFNALAAKLDQPLLDK